MSIFLYEIFEEGEVFAIRTVPRRGISSRGLKSILLEICIIEPKPQTHLFL